MAVSDKKKAAFASLIARQKERRQNESLDGRTNSKGDNKGVQSRHRAEPEPGATGISGASAGDPVVGGDSTNTGPEQNAVAGPGGNLGGSQTDSPEASPGADSDGREGRRRIAPRPPPAPPPDTVKLH